MTPKVNPAAAAASDDEIEGFHGVVVEDYDVFDGTEEGGRQFKAGHNQARL